MLNFMLFCIFEAAPKRVTLREAVQTWKTQVTVGRAPVETQRDDPSGAIDDLQYPIVISYELGEECCRAYMEHHGAYPKKIPTSPTQIIYVALN